MEISLVHVSASRKSSAVIVAPLSRVNRHHEGREVDLWAGRSVHR